MVLREKLLETWTAKIGAAAAHKYVIGVLTVLFAVLALVAGCLAGFILAASTSLRMAYIDTVFYSVWIVAIVGIVVGFSYQRQARVVASTELDRKITWGNVPPRADTLYREWCKKNALQPYSAGQSRAS